MVFVSFMDEFPWYLDEAVLLVPLDVGRWAVISGGKPELRRRIASVCQRTLRRQAQEFLTRPFVERSCVLFTYPMSADETPVFWACGVTPQSVIMESKLPFCITHAPGAMLITDLLNSRLAVM